MSSLQTQQIDVIEGDQMTNDISNNENERISLSSDIVRNLVNSICFMGDTQWEEIFNAPQTIIDLLRPVDEVLHRDNVFMNSVYSIEEMIMNILKFQYRNQLSQVSTASQTFVKCMSFILSIIAMDSVVSNFENNNNNSNATIDENNLFNDIYNCINGDTTQIQNICNKFYKLKSKDLGGMNDNNVDTIRRVISGIMQPSAIDINNYFSLNNNRFELLSKMGKSKANKNELRMTDLKNFYIRSNNSVNTGYVIAGSHPREFRIQL